MHQENIDFGHKMSAFTLHYDALYAEITHAAKLLEQDHISLTDATDGGMGKDIVNSSFWKLWDTETSRIGDFVISQQQHLEFAAKSLLNNIEAALDQVFDKAIGLKERNKCSDMIQCFRLKADELVDSCINLQRFAVYNRNMLEQVGQTADEALGTTCLTYLDTNCSQAPWKSGPESILIVVLSDIYDAIRTAEDDLEKGSAGTSQQWVAPTSFERSTTKYWVPEERLTELLLAAVKEAPLLVYGIKGRLTDRAGYLSKASEGDKLWDQLATPITSIYFDSPSMSLYKERLPRHEGAQLLRARWYGPKPEGDQRIFLELKTHHEKWINTKSIKERVEIKEKDMVNFLALEEWNFGDAEKIVRSANPKLQEAELAKAVDLLLRMHELVIRHGLRPCVRSCYLRAAFQSSASNALRLTIDRNVTLIDETKNVSPGSWCLPDDAIIQNQMATQVPFVVLEVKLSGANVDNMPPVIQDLEGKCIIQEAEKFSKFLTGAAAFNQDKVNALPYWAEHPAFANVFRNSIQSTESRQQTRPRQITSGSMLVGSRDRSDSDGQNSTLSGTTSTSDDQGHLQFSPSHQFLQDAKGSGNQKSFEEFKSNKTTKSRPYGILRRGFFWRKKGSRSAPAISSKRPARVEPKSYFANERTFIQWISASLLLFTISTILLGFEGEGHTASTKSVAHKAGLTICGGAIIIVAYSTASYYRRVHLLSMGKPYGYIDHIGPMILAFSVGVGVIVMVAHFAEQMWRTGQAQVVTTLQAPSSLYSDPDKCFLHSSLGISKLEYEPSDVVVDSKKNLLLATSLKRVVALPLSEPSAKKQIMVRTMVEIPDVDLEALTLVGDRIFALSEGPHKVELIELEWTPREDLLAVVNRWSLTDKPRQAEGMTYIPDATNVFTGRLLINLDQEVHMYEIPERVVEQGVNPIQPSHSTLHQLGSLNSRLLTENLVDPKISSMFYFEGIAYILHDNSKVLRAWDLQSGDMLDEIHLPDIQGKSTAQWEGIAFERRYDGKRMDGIKVSVSNRQSGTDIGSGDGLETNAETPTDTKTDISWGFFDGNVDWDDVKWDDDTDVHDDGNSKDGNPDDVDASPQVSSNLRGHSIDKKRNNPPSLPTKKNGNSRLIMHLALDTPGQIWSFVVEEGPTRGSFKLPACAAAS